MYFVSLSSRFTVLCCSSEGLLTSTFVDWNILSTDVIRNIAASVPTSVEDLSESGVLGDQKLKEYGERLVKQIKKFVEDNQLEDYLSNRPLKRAKIVSEKHGPSSTSSTPKKKQESSTAKSKTIVIELDDDDDDEFAADIDFSAIDLPSGSSSSKAKSPYF
jgi:hypothetical protein